MARFFTESDVLLHRHSGRLLEVISDDNPRRMAIASAMKYRIRLIRGIKNTPPTPLIRGEKKFFTESGVLLHRHSGRLLEVISDDNPRRMAIASAMKYRIRLIRGIKNTPPTPLIRGEKKNFPLIRGERYRSFGFFSPLIRGVGGVFLYLTNHLFHHKQRFTTINIWWQNLDSMVFGNLEKNVDFIAIINF